MAFNPLKFHAYVLSEPDGVEFTPLQPKKKTDQVQFTDNHAANTQLKKQKNERGTLKKELEDFFKLAEDVQKQQQTAQSKSLQGDSRDVVTQFANAYVTAYNKLTLNKDNAPSLKEFILDDIAHRKYEQDFQYEQTRQFHEHREFFKKILPDNNIVSKLESQELKVQSTNSSDMLKNSKLNIGLSKQFFGIDPAKYKQFEADINELQNLDARIMQLREKLAGLKSDDTQERKQSSSKNSLENELTNNLQIEIDSIVVSKKTGDDIQNKVDLATQAKERDLKDIREECKDYLLKEALQKKNPGGVQRVFLDDILQSIIESFIASCENSGIDLNTFYASLLIQEHINLRQQSIDVLEVLAGEKEFNEPNGLAQRIFDAKDDELENLLSAARQLNTDKKKELEGDPQKISQFLKANNLTSGDSRWLKEPANYRNVLMTFQKVLSVEKLLSSSDLDYQQIDVDTFRKQYDKKHGLSNQNQQNTRKKSIIGDNPLYNPNGSTEPLPENKVSVEASSIEDPGTPSATTHLKK